MHHLKLFIFPLLLLGVLLTACEKEITYKGEAFNPLLVVSSDVCADTILYCYLTATTPTLGDYSQTYFGKRSENYVTDATVQMRINGGEWLPTTYKYHRYTVPGVQARAGDVIDLQVTHSQYGTATASERVPERVTVSAVHTTDLYPVVNDSGWVQFALDLAPFSSQDSTYIGVRIVDGRLSCVKQVLKYSYEEVWDESGNVQDYDHCDTLSVRDTVWLNRLYSTGEQWNIFLNSRAEGSPYYGTMNMNWLYLPSSCVRNGLTLNMLADHAWGGEVIGLDSVEVQDLEIEVGTFSLSYILYRTSVLQNDMWYSGIQRPSFAEYDERYAGDDADYEMMDYLLELLSEMSVLGGQEGVPIYSNVDGALGCFSTHTTRRIQVTN